MAKKQKLKLNVPGSLNQITLGEYQEYLTEVENNKEDVDETNKALISIFCDVPKNKVELFTGSQIMEVTNLLSSLIDNRNKNLIREFSIGDVDFGFIPDLEEATFGEWTDIDSYLSDHRNWHRLATVMFRPITDKMFDKELGANRYSIEEYTNTKKYAESMRLMPLDVFFSGYQFFSDLGIELLKTIPSCLEEQMASKEVQQLLKDLEKNGDGSAPTTASVKETLEDYRRLVTSMS